MPPVWNGNYWQMPPPPTPAAPQPRVVSASSPVTSVSYGASEPFVYHYKPTGAPPNPPAAPTPAPAPAPAPAMRPSYFIVQPYQAPWQVAYCFQQPAMTVPAPVVTAATPAPAPHGTATNPFIYQGQTVHEVQRQNALLAQHAGAFNPVPLTPYKATPGQQWWCRELDGSYTLRTTQTIQDALQPGYWAHAPNGNYPYFIRQQAPA